MASSIRDFVSVRPQTSYVILEPPDRSSSSVAAVARDALPRQSTGRFSKLKNLIKKIVRTPDRSTPYPIDFDIDERRKPDLFDNLAMEMRL